MNVLYYVSGEKVYCKGKGDRGKAEALKKLVGCLGEAERAHFRFAGGWWVFVRGTRGWLCTFTSRRELPDSLRLQLLAMLDGLEKEVEGKWQLL